jgi:hypothetical protein
MGSDRSRPPLRKRLISFRGSGWALNEDKSTWLGMVTLSEGPLNEVLHVDPGAWPAVDGADHNPTQARRNTIL